jgi:hypothetical protein
MTAKTLLLGWWSPVSLILTPFWVLYNLIPRARVSRLPAPAPPPDGSRYQRPADPGRPLLARRNAQIGLMVPTIVVLLIGYGIIFG